MGQYFKGYYFKCCQGNQSIALIPALHSDGKNQTASLQIITEDGAYAIPYPDISFSDKPFRIQIGENRFSSKGILLNACPDGLKISGRLRFGSLEKPKYDIMGPFRHVPFMQCRHSVVSMGHSVTGRLQLQHLADKHSLTYDFKNAFGYIEGDRGRSFPREYAWTQCHFRDASLMLAVADVPFAGFRFRGIIGFVMLGDREYRIATYLGAKVIFAGNNEILVKQGKYTLYARLIHARHQGLNAPVKGRMIRTIHESVACRAYYRFTCENKILLEFTSDRASFEYEL